MTLADLAIRARKLASDNSPAILTALATAGVITTGILTAKATLKAAEKLTLEKLRQSEEHGVTVRDPNQVLLTPQEKIKLTWRCYIPAAGSAVATIACIILANRIGTRRTAAIAAAYSIAEKGFTEYKEKVVEKLGEKKERDIRDEVAQDRINANPVGTREVIITGNGNVLCFDAYSGRYFESDMQTLRKAENDVNFSINNNDYASLTDFYNAVGLAPTAMSDDVGWNTNRKLTLDISTTVSQDERPCFHIAFVNDPGPNYYRGH